MNSIDAILFAVIAVSAVWGAWRGMLRSVYGLAAFAVAFWLAKNHAPALFLHLTSGRGSPLSVLAFSYVLVFFGVLIPLMVIAHVLRRIMQKLDLISLDRIAGFVFGFFRGVLLAFIGVIMFSFLPFVDKNALAESVFLPVAGSTLNRALNWQPLQKYRRYWKFDTETGAPVFDAKALAEAEVLKHYLPEGFQLPAGGLPEEIKIPEGLELPEGIKLPDGVIEDKGGESGDK